MKSFAWITDPHFNCISMSKRIEFFAQLSRLKVDGILITGDISDGLNLPVDLQMLADFCKQPIYWTHGNHDYYRSSFSAVQDCASILMKNNSNMHYLGVCQPISLTPEVALIGHDGWYDARWRDPLTSLVFLCDWLMIKEFRELSTYDERIEMSRQRAQVSAQYIKKSLLKAFETHSTVMLMTHFPPWPQAAPCYNRITERFWLPYNSCKIIADTIDEVMAGLQDKKLQVYSGHTHDECSVRIAHNIEIRVGRAKRGQSFVQDIILV